MTDRVRKDPLTGLEIEFVPAEGEPLPGGIGPASSNRVQFEVEAETREHLDWLLGIYGERVHSYGYDPTAALPYHVRITAETKATR